MDVWRGRENEVCLGISVREASNKASRELRKRKK